MRNEFKLERATVEYYFPLEDNLLVFGRMVFNDVVWFVKISIDIIISKQ